MATSAPDADVSRVVHWLRHPLSIRLLTDWPHSASFFQPNVAGRVCDSISEEGMGTSLLLRMAIRVRRPSADGCFASRRRSGSGRCAKDRSLPALMGSRLMPWASIRRCVIPAAQALSSRGRLASDSSGCSLPTRRGRLPHHLRHRGRRTRCHRCVSRCTAPVRPRTKPAQKLDRASRYGGRHVPAAVAHLACQMDARRHKTASG